MLWSFNLRKGKKRNERTIARLALQLDSLRELENQLQKLKEEKTLENGISETQELNRLKNRHDEQLKKFITLYFLILSRIEREYRNTPDQTAVETERLNKILFGSSKIDFWAAAQKLIPEGLPEKIKKLCPELDNTELKICCLTYLNADIAAMSLAIGVKDKSIYTMNSSIRAKLEIDQRKNIRQFIEEKLTK